VLTHEPQRGPPEKEATTQPRRLRNVLVPCERQRDAKTHRNRGNQHKPAANR
jgi:hypothetical protein